MSKKYILTNETKIFNGRTLHRIKAVKSFRDVHIGDLGGWIESEYNLSQFEDCWIYDDAIVEGYARVYHNAIVEGTAWVYDNAHIFGNARVSNNSRVFNEARVTGNARVMDNAQISGKAWVYDDAIVYDNALIFEDATIYGNAKVFGDIRLREYSRVGGNAEVSNDYDILYISKIGKENGPITFCRSRDSIVVSHWYKEPVDISVFEKLNTDDMEYQLAIKLARLRILEGE